MYWSIVIFTFIFLVLPVFFFFYLFDEDQVKQLIVEQFDINNYHANVVGHVSPKFWHGLSLDFKDVEVDTKDYDTLFKIKNMSCQLSWLDLVFARYKVRRMALNDVEINEANLLKNNANIGNLFNLSNQRRDVFSRITLFNVYGIHAASGQIPYRFSDGAIKITQSGSGAQFEFGFKLEDQNTFVLTSGRLTDITNNTLEFNDFQVRLYKDQNSQLKLNSVARYEMDKRLLVLSNVVGTLDKNNYKSDILASSLFFSLTGAGAKELQLNMDYGNALISHNIKMTVNQLVASNYKQLHIDKIDTKYTTGYNGNKVELLSSLSDINYSESSTSVVATHCVNQVNLSSLNFATSKFSGTLSGSCKYLPKQSLFDFDLNGQLNNAPLKLNMQLYNKGKPLLILSGNMDELDLSRIKVNKNKFLPLLYDSSRLPFDWLSLIDVDGDLTVKHFALDRINLHNLVTKFAVNDSTLDINKIRADIYKGVLDGQAKIKKTGENNYDISAKQVVNNVNLEDMFSDLFDVQAISGQANLAVDIAAHGMHSYNDLYHNLNGNITLGATHGAFQGVDFNLFVNPDGMALTSKKSTAFEQLKANFNFNSGVSKNGQVSFSSKYVIAKGGGVVDFDNSKIDYTLAIKSALPHNDEQINSVLIPVIVSGDLFSPKINIKNIHLYSTDIVAPVVPKSTTPGKHVKKKHSHR